MVDRQRYQELTIQLMGGYTAYGRFWPASPMRGSVLYHHGIQSHCGWYEDSAAALASAGFAVLQWDRRGCGRNDIARGDAESAEQLVADAMRARDELRRRTGRREYHVVGVSWGGRLAVTGYLAEPAGVQSLSLVAPGLFPRVGVSKDQAAQIAMAMLYEPQTLFDIPLGSPEHFTDDEKWRAFVEKDALTLRQATAGFYLASRRMDKKIARLGEAEPIPLHFLLAGKEGIIDTEKTEAFAAELAWPDIRVTHFPESKHSLGHGPEAERYFEELVGFVAGVNG